MKKQAFYALLFLIAFVSCKTKTIEVVEESYPDGSPKLTKYYTDNKARELVKEIQFYPNHKKFIEGEFKNNRKDGKWISYYETGIKWSEGFFKEGLDDGERISYYEDGKIRYKGYYKKGKMTGKWKFYDEKGNFLEEKDYK